MLVKFRKTKSHTYEAYIDAKISDIIYRGSSGWISFSGDNKHMTNWLCNFIITHFDMNCCKIETTLKCQSLKVQFNDVSEEAYFLLLTSDGVEILNSSN